VAQVGPDDELRFLSFEGPDAVRLHRFVAPTGYRRISRGTFKHKGQWGPLGGPECFLDAGGEILAVGRRLAPGAAGQLDLVATATGRTLATLSVPGGNAPRVLGPDGSSGLLVYSANAFGLVRWPVRADPETGGQRVGPPQRLLWEKGEHTWGASADGRTIAIPKRDGPVVVSLDRPGRRVVLDPGADLRFCAVSPDGSLVFTGRHSVTPGQNGCKVWRAADGNLVRELPVGYGMGSFSPDGKWLVTMGHGPRLWRVPTWEAGPVLSDEEVECVFAPDGRTVACGGLRGVVRLCATDSGRELALLEVPGQTTLNPKCFSRDGGRLVAHSSDGVVHVWDLRVLRARLVEMGLDWDAPSLPPAGPARPPPRIDVDPGAIALFQDPPGEPAGDALRRLTTILRADPDDVEAYHFRAHAYHAQGSFAKAVADFGEALKRREDPHFLAARANDRLPLKQYDAALADLERCLKLEGGQANEAWACHLLARLLTRGPGPRRDARRALRLAERAIKLAPRQAAYRGTLGIALYHNGRPRDAVQRLKEALQGTPGPDGACYLFYLAMCHHRLDERANARDDFESAKRRSTAWDLPAWQKELLRAYEADAQAALAAKPR
jgi:tetratricopeptide (TPR) repeat protein